MKMKGQGTTYSISELEEISGVKAHTIRTWEKRYGVVKPARNASNVRYYTESDLRLLVNIAFLNQHGIRISKIAEMTKEEIDDHVTQYRTTNAEVQNKIGSLSMALMDLDPSKLECIINSQIRHLGVEGALMDVLYPFLERVSLMLVSGSIGQLHKNLLTEILHQKLRAAIDNTARVPGSQPHFLLFSSLSGFADINRLFVYFLARHIGLHVIPFSANLSAPDIERAIAHCKPAYICLLHDMSAPAETLETVVQASKEVGGEATLILCGQDLMTDGLEMPERYEILNGIQEMSAFLHSLDVSEGPQ